jgi:hypothetical protein
MKEKQKDQQARKPCRQRKGQENLADKEKARKTNRNQEKDNELEKEG